MIDLQEPRAEPEGMRGGPGGLETFFKGAVPVEVLFFPGPHPSLCLMLEFARSTGILNQSALLMSSKYLRFTMRHIL